ncbi:class I SAM-dependent methyltransferase [Aquibaculum arenosum]|uniref:Class I SAM-dependent methyltransferase n=1 Tax=Aquibaculum arenosum TaxID=3032591 RepID=A0ABT5YRF4_9PROT|nr:class I SAM-dependent methyltransferase [Fodinicurvata sp. CAU 1616]MDF2097422.1 class I SAM-dependent methyltransferase [Fodinicurvata sp. CAU 1616]
MTEDLRLSPRVLLADDWRDYELVDSGNGHKLERYGRFRFVRPEPQALWSPSLPEEAWSADGVFDADETDSGRWRFDKEVPESWTLGWGPLRFAARCTPFRHLGFFPEQAPHWSWCNEQLSGRETPPKVLNLFAYTGLASLAAASAGAAVTHVDASKKSIGYAVENQKLSGMEEAPIRWIVDDTMKFVRREVRRGRRYDGIILDPPKYGRGAKGEVWRLEDDLPELLELGRQLLSERPAFLLLTVYAVRLSYLAIQQALTEALAPLGGRVEAGEMALPETSGGRLLPTAIFARWRPD